MHRSTLPTRDVPDLIHRRLDGRDDREPGPQRGTDPDHDGERAPGDRADVVADLGAHDRELRDRRVDDAGLERGIVPEHRGGHADHDQHQREQREEPVVGDQRSQTPSPVVAELPDDGGRERRPDDGVAGRRRSCAACVARRSSGECSRHPPRGNPVTGIRKARRARPGSRLPQVAEGRGRSGRDRRRGHPRRRAPHELLHDPSRVAAHPRDHVRRRPRTGTAARRSTGPARSSRRPRSCIGAPSSPKIGRSIHDRSWRNPTHQTTFATSSSTRPPSTTGLPSRTSDRPSRRARSPAAVELLRLHAHERIALAAHLRDRPAADRVAAGEHVHAQRTGSGGTRRCARSSRRCPTGMWPDSGSPTTWSGASSATSIEMSAPEFPTPTTSTGPSRSWDGFRYALECSCTIDGSRSAANAGTRGSRCAPEATTTFVASNRVAPRTRRSGHPRGARRRPAPRSAPASRNRAAYASR